MNEPPRSRVALGTALNRVPVRLLVFGAGVALLIWWCSGSPSEQKNCDEFFFNRSNVLACEKALTEAVFDARFDLSDCATCDLFHRPCVEAIGAAPTDVSGVVSACSGIYFPAHATNCVVAASITGGGAPVVYRCMNEYDWDGDIVACVSTDRESLDRLLGWAKEGDARAQYALGLVYSDLQGVPNRFGVTDEIAGKKDFHEAATWYRKAAEQGHAEAQSRLAQAYYRGRGVDRDPAEAARWWREAAERGLAYAQYRLALSYERGSGVPRDHSAAAVWYRQAAEQEDARAQRKLGDLYANGQGVPHNDGKALSWYRRAAEQDSQLAQAKIASMYADGRGVEQDDVKAFEWYQKAAVLSYRPVDRDPGVPWAQNELGKMYAEGRGVSQDFEEAARWYDRAADQDFAPAQYNLAQLHEIGVGTFQSLERAIQLYRKAARRGEERAAAALQRLGEPVPDAPE